MHLLKICVYLGWVLRILWSEVTNNFGFPKIRVFLGPNLKVLWSEVTNNFGFPEIHVFLGPNLRVLWSKVTNNFAVPEICVLGEISCWGHKRNISAKFRSLLLLERCKICMKIYILGNFEVRH